MPELYNMLKGENKDLEGIEEKINTSPTLDKPQKTNKETSEKKDKEKKNSKKYSSNIIPLYVNGKNIEVLKILKEVKNSGRSVSAFICECILNNHSNKNVSEKLDKIENMLSNMQLAPVTNVTNVIENKPKNDESEQKKKDSVSKSHENSVLRGLIDDF